MMNINVYRHRCQFSTYHLQPNAISPNPPVTGRNDACSSQRLLTNRPSEVEFAMQIARVMRFGRSSTRDNSPRL